MSFRKIKKGKRVIRDAKGRARYEINVRVEGKQVRRLIWAKDDAEALDHIDRMKGVRGSESGAAWREVLAAFLTAKPKQDRLERDYGLSVAWFAERCHPTIEGTTLRDFSAALREKAGGDPKKGRTANKYREQALAVARWGLQNGLVGAVPFDACPRVQESHVERTAFTLEELPRYLAALKDERARLLAEALVLTGERVSAVAGIRVVDIGVDAVTVTQKGGRHRQIPLTLPLKAVLDRAKEISGDSGHVFRNSRGNPWTDTAFNHHCRKAWKDLPHRTPHELRHTVATQAAAMGMSRDMIQAVLGHASPETARHYVHHAQMEATTRDALERLQAEILPNSSHVAGTSEAGLSVSMLSGTRVSISHNCPKCGTKSSVIWDLDPKAMGGKG